MISRPDESSGIQSQIVSELEMSECALIEMEDLYKRWLNEIFSMPRVHNFSL